MSAIFQRVMSDIGTISSLFAGPLVQLGDFAFQAGEIPEKIEWGGKQNLVVHKYPGGSRTLDAMGQDDSDIHWTGIFLGNDYISRAQKLNKIRIAGQAVVLSWGSLRQNVVVANLDFVQKFGLIEYSITCTPTQLPINATGQQTLLGSITNDIGNALGIDIPATMTTVQNAINEVKPFVAAAATLTGGSPAALNILGAVNSASSITNQISTTANNTIGAFSSGSSPFSFANPSAASSLIGRLGDSVRQASASMNIAPFLSRMSSNLQNTSAG